MLNWVEFLSHLSRNTGTDNDITENLIPDIDVNLHDPSGSNHPRVEDFDPLHNILDNLNVQYGGGVSGPSVEPVTDDQDGDGGEPIHKGKLFTVLQKSERFYKKFNTQGVYYSLEVANPPTTGNPETWLTELLEGIINYFLNNSKLRVNPGDRIGMTLDNTLLDYRPVYISLRRADQMVASIVLDHIMSIFDSNKAFF